MAEQYDVIIVGGGLVGTSLAAALGGSSLQVAIIEPRAASGQWEPEGFDSRVCALTPATRDWLVELAAWRGIEAERYATFDDVCVWDGDGTASVHFAATDVGVDHLGYIVENRVTVKALAEATAAHRNIEWICPDAVETLDAFADAMLSIAQEARDDPDAVRSAPSTQVVRRLDEVKAVREPVLRYAYDEHPTSE
ncbi:MAG: hypothetical protein ACE5EV_08170 [Gaiellales bacterium]